MKAVVALLLLGSAIALAQSVGTFTSSDAANNARRVYNNEFHGGSMFGFSSAFVSGSLNLPTTCPGQNGNTLNNYGYPADCIACPCNVPAQFVTSVCADSSRPFMGHRGCTLAFVGAVGGVAVRCVSTDGTCRLSVQRHGEVNITTSLRCNPSSIGGVTLPTNVTLHVQLISESKFVVSSSGAFMFAGVGERSVRRFNPFFRMRRLKKNQLGHGGPAGGLGGGYGGQGGLDNGNIWLAPGAASVGVSGGDSGAFGSTNGGPFNGGPGGHGNDEFESDDEFMARRDAFITRRFRNFRCPSVAGLINFPDPRSNEQDDDDWGRFDRDDETCIGTGNGLSDFSDFNDNQCDNVGGLGGGHGGNTDNGGAFGSDYNHGQGLLNGGNYCGGGQ